MKAVYVLCSLMVAGFASSQSSNIKTVRLSNGYRVPANYVSYPCISDDGRYIAYLSESSEHGPVDDNGLPDVYIKDTVLGICKRLSIGIGGTESNGRSFAPSISGDGQRVAFRSDATNLVPGDTNGLRDVFVANVSTGQIERVNVTPLGLQVSEVSAFDSGHCLNYDGRFVAFESKSPNLVPNDTNLRRDIFVRDLIVGQTRLVSSSAGGELASHDCTIGKGSLSGDGSVITFVSAASNLVQNDLNSSRDGFRKDIVSGQIERISVTYLGSEIAGDTYSTSISGNGRLVAFNVYAEVTAVTLDPRYRDDIYVRDTLTQSTVRALAQYDPGSHSSESIADPAISANGQFVAFSTTINGISPGDTNNDRDVYRVRLLDGLVQCASVNYVGQIVDGASGQYGCDISASGHIVVFQTHATLADRGEGSHIYFRNFEESHSRPACEIEDGSSDATWYRLRCTSDSRYIAFSSSARNLLVEPVVTSSSHSYRFDRKTGDITLLSMDAAGVPFTRGAAIEAISSNGNLCMLSTIEKVSPLETSFNNDLYVRNVAERTFKLVSGDVAGLVQGFVTAGNLDASGSLAVFSSKGALVPGDTAIEDVYVKHVETGEVERVSVSTLGVPGTDQSNFPMITADGRYVIFISSARNFSGNNIASPDVFVRDRLLLTTTLASGNFSTGAPAGGCSGPAISNDGRFVAFESTASNLVPSDTNGRRDIFVRDMLTGATTIVSIRPDGTQSNGNSASPKFTDDGRYLTFTTQASNLAPGASSISEYGMRKDLVTGQLQVLCPHFAELSGDGRTLYFGYGGWDPLQGGTGNSRLYARGPFITRAGGPRQ